LEKQIKEENNQRKNRKRAVLPSKNRKNNRQLGANERKRTNK
jgi:hypothetical protein